MEVQVVYSAVLKIKTLLPFSHLKLEHRIKMEKHCFFYTKKPVLVKTSSFSKKQNL